MHHLSLFRLGTAAFSRCIVGWLMVLCVGTTYAQLVVPAGGSFSVPAAGFLNLACTALDVQGTLTLGNGQIAQANNVTIGTAGSFDAGSGTLTTGGNWANNGTFLPGTSTVSFVDGCGSASAQISGNTTFNNLTLISSTGRSFVFPAGSSITVNGTLTIQGTPGNPVQIIAPGGQAGTSVIRLGPNAQVVQSNATIAPNVQIGNALPAAANTQSVPTLSEWGIALLALLLVGIAARHLPKRRTAAPFRSV